jgi:anti-sigma regulatory factor (Ser/Thr protein kinase)
MDANVPKRESCLLPPSANAPARARRFVSDALEHWGVGDVFVDVPLITSELVTNAVRHARSRVNVSIDLEAERVRVEVEDRSQLLPVLADIDLARDGGWGLHIVERLSTRWGLEPHGDGKTVWCEVETRHSAEPPRQR